MSGYSVTDGLRDAMLLAGTGLLAYGAWLTYPPAGFMVPGVVLIAVALGGLLR